MLIPQSQNLHSQSFLLDKYEFVWVFQDKIGIIQFVFGVDKTGGCYIEAGLIDSVGNYIESPFYFQTSSPNQLVRTDGWGLNQNGPPLYNNFTNGKDLISLANECIIYLR